MTVLYSSELSRHAPAYYSQQSQPLFPATTNKIDTHLWAIFSCMSHLHQAPSKHHPCVYHTPFVPHVPPYLRETSRQSHNHKSTTEISHGSGYNDLRCNLQEFLIKKTIYSKKAVSQPSTPPALYTSDNTVQPSATDTPFFPRRHLKSSSSVGFMPASEARPPAILLRQPGSWLICP